MWGYHDKQHGGQQCSTTMYREETDGVGDLILGSLFGVNRGTGSVLFVLIIFTITLVPFSNMRNCVFMYTVLYDVVVMAAFSFSSDSG